MSEANRLLIEESIRQVLGALILAGFIASIYLAARRFLGSAGKTATRNALIFAGSTAALLLLLLSLRGAIESFISKAAASLISLTSSNSEWPAQAAVGVFRTFIVVLVLILIIQAIGRTYWYLEGRLVRIQSTRKGVTTHLVVFLTTLLKIFRIVSVAALVIASLPVVLSFFPRTKTLVDRTGGFLSTPARDVGLAILAYLPNLGYVIIIVVVWFYCLKVTRYFFTAVERGTLVIKGFVPEWANPTYRLVRTLFVVFLVMVTYPYLPGSKSQFFQGFSVFVGALITFGSTATIGNIVSGTVLTYTRAFRMGDVVKIGDSTGIVIEKTLLVTRLLTFQNEEVSIPNGNVLATPVLNYSARAPQGLILSVTAGIGYDVDWRTVHKLMIDGAKATERILTEPAPEIYQSALGDYAVNYELRAFTNQPVWMLQTLSELRANVLDAFNRAGVEIMTPSILAHRDASNLAVPMEQFRDRPKAGGIAIEVRNDGSVSTSV